MAESSKIDLHQLANTPGFGKAAEVLIKAGAWDEYAAAGNEREFVVSLDAEIIVCTTVTVMARCEAEARKKATALACKRDDWDFPLVDEDEVEVVHVIDSTKT